MKYIKSLIFSSLLIVSSCSNNKIPYSRQEFLKQNDAILQNADVSAESKALTCEKPTISKKETFFSGASKYGNNEGSWCKVSMDDLTEFLDFSFHNMNNIQNGMDTDKLQKEYVNVRDKTFGTNALKISDIFSNNLAFSATLSKDDTNNVSSAYERITAGTNDITTLVFLFDEIYSFNQIKKDRLTNGVLVREAKEKEGNDKNDKTNARMKHIYQHFVNGTNARAVKSGFVGLLNYDKALRHIESCDVFGDYTDDYCRTRT